MKRLVMVGVFCLIAGCGGNDTGPSNLSLSGTWAGRAVSNMFGGINIQVSLTQSGSSLTGTWVSDQNSGQLTGSVGGSSVSANLTSADPRQCPFTVTATVSGSSMSGTYAAYNCTVADGGTISLTKR